MAEERVIPMPVLGHRGEQQASGVGAFEPGEMRQLKNGWVTGVGVVEQTPDFALADTCLDASAGDQVHGVAGVFPFATQGDAASPSAGVAFAFDLQAFELYLYQLDEDGSIMRQFTIDEVWDDEEPAQITGFEMEQKFFFCPYGKEVASDRRGMGYFNPAGIPIGSSDASDPVVITIVAHGFATNTRVVITGSDAGIYDGIHTITSTGADTFTLPGIAGDSSSNGEIYVVWPAYALDGGTPTPLLFRGIFKHRGGTILGWGYRNENDPDRAGFLLWCKYTQPLVWSPDTTDTSAGAVIIGTPDLEIVTCVQSGQYTIIGKQSEVFALDGDYGSQFYARQIGNRHGPVSTVGAASNGEVGFWMSNEGPAFSDRGGPVQLLVSSRYTRQMLRYIDLVNSWAVHDGRHERIIWTMRRSLDDRDAVLTEPAAGQLLIFDYARNALYRRDMPGPVWSVGKTVGVGALIPGPVGLLSIEAATNITLTSFQVNFTPGDTSPGVQYELQYKVNGTDTWVNGPSSFAGETNKVINGLVIDTLYDVRMRQVRNGQTQDYVESLAYATTTDFPVDASNVRLIGQVDDVPSLTTVLSIGYTPNFDGLRVNLYFNTVDNSGTATLVTTSNTSAAGAVTDPNDRAHNAIVYYWVEFEDSTGTTSVNRVASSDNPLTVNVGSIGPVV